MNEIFLSLISNKGSIFLIGGFFSLSVSITILTLYFIKTKNRLIEEITERKNAENALKISEEKYRLAIEDSNNSNVYYDQLTYLPNRFLIERIASSELVTAGENKSKVSIMYMDLDNFKDVNDTLGHTVGDELLKKVGKLIENTTSNLETVGRLGGDEFILVLSQANTKEKVTEYANKIIGLFNKPIVINEREIFITTSIGIAMYPDDGKDFNTLSKSADMAMYNAKGLGKNRYKYFTAELNKAAIEKSEVEDGLRHAIQNKELKVFYQAQINLKTARIDGMEALVRWFHPEKGMISPTKFIPLAEETGLIIPIGNIVLYEACIQNKMWQEIGFAPLRVAVNLSAKQFEQENLVEVIQEILAKTRLEPKWLELEITESIIMKNFELSIEILNKFRGMGIHVSLDDFGTGYSSLNYLKRLPIDTLKIDKSFVDNITQDSNDEIIAKAVIELAHKMGLEVVAEGVEEVEQLNFLKEQKCDKIQGFLFSKPVSEEDFQKLIKSSQTYKNNKQLIFNEH